MRVGGRAEWLLEPSTPEEFRQAWIAALERGGPVRVLGGGANLLVHDGELPGVVITTERMTRTFRAEDTREPVLVAWAGASMPGLVRTARELGLTGLEGLVGVPGHLGGGIAMNAGGRWGELWDVVERVHLLVPDGELVERPRAECSPSYRNGGLGDDVALGAVLRLEHGDREEIRERMRAYLAEKSAAQPVTERSSGCIFKNPDPELSDGRSAGKLVEDCGGKGLTRGDAVVSPKHGNFIVNRGGATAADVLGLIDDLKRLVADRTGIVLDREVRVWEAGAVGESGRKGLPGRFR
ncbi:MAG: UDP-N-acetylmuramate dehydrogenase [Planctomycetota bacterium]|nr:UDP-N-acetylmuramate dehydrogenase [Planctomycetota bacterium]